MLWWNTDIKTHSIQINLNTTYRERKIVIISILKKSELITKTFWKCHALTSFLSWLNEWFMVLNFSTNYRTSMILLYCTDTIQTIYYRLSWFDRNKAFGLDSHSHKSWKGLTDSYSCSGLLSKQVYSVWIAFHMTIIDVKLD